MHTQGIRPTGASNIYKCKLGNQAKSNNRYVQVVFAIVSGSATLYCNKACAKLGQFMFVTVAFNRCNSSIRDPNMLTDTDSSGPASASNIHYYTILSII